MKNFDLVIIGGGAGAFAAAIRANELKINTAMINAGLPLGGTCVNVGCVPSKILLHAGEVLHRAKTHHVSGIALEVAQFDFAAVVEEELAMVAASRKDKYENVLAGLEHVTLIEGYATFTGEKEVVVQGEKLSAEKFIIATGSTASIPPIPQLREVGFVTHIEALHLKERPESLAIIGAGPVGLEFAQMYARFGTKVTILQKDDTILTGAEPELTARLTEILENEGVTIHTKAAISRAEKEDSKKVLVFEQEGVQEKVAADEILVAAGKTPNTKGLGLEHAGVVVDARGAVVVNEWLQTNQPHIFAVGDVTNAPLRLETTAGREGTLAAENAVSGTQHRIDYRSVPRTVFTDPQFASVGWTEQEQMETAGVCACRTVPFEIIPKAQIMRRTEGLIKMGVDPKTGEIRGIHMLAPNAGDLIAQGALLIQNRNTLDDLLRSLPVFPTLSESFKYAALAFTKDVAKLSCCI